MELSGIELLFSNSPYAFVGGWLCLLAALFFALRRPAANANMVMPFVGMGGVQLIGEYSYGRISAFVGLLAFCLLLWRSRRVGAVSLGAMAHTPLAWFAGLCLVIATKIGIETLVYGLDASRSSNLILGVVAVGFPSVLVLRSVMSAEPEQVARDLLVGMVTFPLLMMVGYVPFALEHGLLLSAWQGQSRIAIGGSNTISSAAVLTSATIASLLVYTQPHPGWAGRAFKAAVLSVALGFGVLVLLCGTRQHMLALAVFLLLWAFLLQGNTMVRWLVSLGVFVCLGFVGVALFSQEGSILQRRVSTETLKGEIVEGRGAIWNQALLEMLEHPLLGTGFKNFGEELGAVSRAGEMIIVRDSAHGVVQDVFTEHGIPLGIAFLAGCLHLLASSWRAVRQEQRMTAERALTVGLIAMQAALPFSSSFLNATPLYLLLLIALARDGRRQRPAAARSKKKLAGRRLASPTPAGTGQG